MTLKKDLKLYGTKNICIKEESLNERILKF